MKKNRLKEILNLKKRGAASMFVVVFTIMILSVIVLSFTRLIISESTKMTNNDLSQSAYDSALAGVEDAKIALLRYHDCLDQGYTASSSGTCGDIIRNMQEGIANNDCSTVANVLSRESNENTSNSVVVQETQNSADSGNNTNMLQAYTCVTIKENLDDYRTTLSSAGRLRIIPIRSDHIDTLEKVKIRWFSKTNYAKLGLSKPYYCGNNMIDGVLALYPNHECNGDYQTPPSLTVRLIQTDASFKLSELSVSSSASQTDTGELVLLPTDSGGTNSIAKTAWGESANKGKNVPTQVHCGISAGTDWYCETDVYLPETFKGSTNRNDANTYLLVSLPYGAPETDLSIMAYGPGASGGTERFDFTGVQARIDSTGRANDLYRRVETRVELVDTYFAYPEYEITMTGAHSNIYKTFYATFDCFKSDRGAGSAGNCSNTSEDDTLDSFH